MKRPAIGAHYQGPAGRVEVRATTEHKTLATIQRPGMKEPESVEDMVITNHGEFFNTYRKTD